MSSRAGAGPKAGRTARFAGTGTSGGRNNANPEPVAIFSVIPGAAAQAKLLRLAPELRPRSMSEPLNNEHTPAALHLSMPSADDKDPMPNPQRPTLNASDIIPLAWLSLVGWAYYQLAIADWRPGPDGGAAPG